MLLKLNENNYNLSELLLCSSLLNTKKCMLLKSVSECVFFYRIYVSLKPPWYLHHPDLSLRVGRKAVNNKNSARSASLDDFRFLLGN